uniref:Uncharacterized protein n=1 Tax=Oryza glumipatula TaxID=40148 RepID=A0A0D9Y1Y9_9ORYZ
MLKLALAMISAAFRTTPFSMSMQLCPNATMSLHSPSIFDVVSSITPIMSCIINNSGACTSVEQGGYWVACDVVAEAASQRPGPGNSSKGQGERGSLLLACSHSK